MVHSYYALEIRPALNVHRFSLDCQLRHYRRKRTANIPATKSTHNNEHRSKTLKSIFPNKVSLRYKFIRIDV